MKKITHSMILLVGEGRGGKVKEGKGEGVQGPRLALVWEPNG